jgi:glutaredoxin
MIRAIVFLALAALLVLGSLEYGPQAMQKLGLSSHSSDLSDRPDPGEPVAEIPDYSGSDDEAEDADEAPVGRTTYRYFDGSGTLHFVDALEKVPEAYRASAKPIGGSDLPQLTRARDKKPRRPSIRKIDRDQGMAPQQAPAARRASAGVVLYSTSWCGWCRKTMAWLDERGIEYENRDIERNDAWRTELIEKTGKSSIPMVEIDGEIIQGFNPDRMGELL